MLLIVEHKKFKFKKEPSIVLYNKIPGINGIHKNIRVNERKYLLLAYIKGIIAALKIIKQVIITI
jgi:hypothetical protein